MLQPDFEKKNNIKERDSSLSGILFTKVRCRRPVEVGPVVYWVPVAVRWSMFVFLGWVFRMLYFLDGLI